MYIQVIVATVPRGTHRQMPTYGVGGEGGVEPAYPNFFS